MRGVDAAGALQELLAGSVRADSTDVGNLVTSRSSGAVPQDALATHSRCAHWS